MYRIFLIAVDAERYCNPTEKENESKEDQNHSVDLDVPLGDLFVHLVSRLSDLNGELYHGADLESPEYRFRRERD